MDIASAAELIERNQKLRQQFQAYDDGTILLQLLQAPFDELHLNPTIVRSSDQRKQHFFAVFCKTVRQARYPV